MIRLAVVALLVLGCATAAPPTQSPAERHVIERLDALNAVVPTDPDMEKGLAWLSAEYGWVQEHPEARTGPTRPYAELVEEAFLGIASGDDISVPMNELLAMRVSLKARSSGGSPPSQ